jgi:FlaA1/EpsC-like NDP-sugar epimerase
MGERGEVFVLDMGEPLKITDLARHMVSLSGMTLRDDDNPTGDIEICYVGLRPGEKLHEELFLGQNLVTTRHPRIQMAKERVVPRKELERMLDGLKEALELGNRAVVRNRLADFIVEEHDEGAISLELVRTSGSSGEL